MSFVDEIFQMFWRVDDILFNVLINVDAIKFGLKNSLMLMKSRSSRINSNSSCLA
jgi:hypothetical protein